jgi:UDP-glucose 4-epimerase
MNKKNILIFGATGFIGSKLLEQLILLDHNITIITRNNNLDKKYSKNIEVKIGCLEDIDLIESIIRTKSINIVIHLSTTLIPSSSFNEYLQDISYIIKPTIKLLPLFSKYKIKFIYFSSGGSIYGLNDSGIYTENDLTSPISYYGQSKKILEDSIILENKISSLNYIIIRPSNPFGIGQSLYGKQGFIAVAIGCLLNDKTMTVWGDGNIVRDYIYIDNLVDCIIKIIEGSSNNEIFNIGNGEGKSLNEIIDFINDISDKKLSILFEPRRSVDPLNIILNISKFNTLYKIDRIPIKEGIFKFFEFEKKINEK